MDFKELLDELNRETNEGAETFDKLSPELRNKIDKGLPPEIVYKEKGAKQIELIKHYINLFA